MDIQTVWDLKPLLKSDDEVEIEKILVSSKEACTILIQKYQANEEYLSDPKVLRQALDDFEVYARTYNGSGVVGYYFFLKSSQNQDDPKIKAMVAKLHDFDVEIHNSLQFFDLRLSKIPSDKQAEFLNSLDLQLYKHYLERLFETARYTLTEAEEKILTLLSYTDYVMWERMTSELLSAEQQEVLGEDLQPVTLPFHEILPLTYNTSKQVREKSAKAINNVFVHHSKPIETELNAVLHSKKVQDQLRNCSRPDISRHVADDIDTTVVDAMITTVKDNFSVSQRFYKLKSKILGVDKLTYFEKNLSIGKSSKKFDFKEALAINLDVFASLDIEFSKFLEQAVTEGTFDVYPKKGKSGGGFCVANRLCDPSYILLNYTGSIRDVTTIAHETGHALNNYYMSRHRHALDFATPLSTAEVASTFFEDFVFEKLLESLDSDDRTALLFDKLEEDISSVFRQVACYLFEQQLHSEYRKEGFVSIDRIGQLFVDNMCGYLGPAIEMSEGSQNWWMHWSHIRSYFYVYSYASGVLISKALQSMVRSDKARINDFKMFLGMGTSESPTSIFANMGVDITKPTFWQKGIDKIEHDLARLEKVSTQ